MDPNFISLVFVAGLVGVHSFPKVSSLRQMNEELQQLSAASATAAWAMSEGGPDSEAAAKEVALLAERKNEWREKWCAAFDAWNGRGSSLGIAPGAIGWQRMVYLLCRGPRYTVPEVRNLSSTLGALQDIYVSARLCTSSANPQCYRGEPDLERLVRTSHKQQILLWAWEGWRRAVGPSALKIYPEAILLQNIGAQRNGYSDASEVWQEVDFENDGLEDLMENLFNEVAPLYKMLHALVRKRLLQFYGEGTHGLCRNGPIPAHLLGNLWAQTWESMLDLVLGKSFQGPSININNALRKRNVTVNKMIQLAEDFYVSLGLPPMTSMFWKKSIFSPISPSTSCHGTAANMFNHSDFRIIICAEVSEEDFYMIHHEMGHIQYYMAYQNQPAIFQDGASPAFQEAVGDAIMLAALTPQHLLRIGVLDDWKWGNMDIVLLLRQALSKLPQLAFSLILDKWRWAVFSGKVTPENYNDAWWSLRRHYQGVDAPLKRKIDDFDPAAKFHVLGNTPYARYFLGGILQMQIFESLCNAAVSQYDSLQGDSNLPPLHQCDIYGSREAGHKLRKMMELGSSRPWPIAMELVTGSNMYNTASLLQYFKPLYHWLEEVIRRENIPVGWD